ncbi:TolC family protein [Mucilaginibacter flavidus]|uniref:TolC family protein n=1 Tax=Mucilaginibacter flavidus TaxID=2949309 RepID=UPI0020934A48|nr:TolC family protein [Mucilaginibacter flavidus]MCO5947573.1 TolC family protein [Mucilaginibacter flavidus]
MKHILIITMLACGFALTGYAQQAPPDTQRYNFTIQDCVNYAYEHQLDVKNANLDVTSADYHVKEIIGQGLPQITGAASFQDYIKTSKILFPNSNKQLYTILHNEGVSGTNGVIAIPNEPDNVAFSFTQKYNASLGLNASLILFDPNYIVGLQGRKTYKELYNRSYTRTKIEASVNVTKAYYQVLVSVEQLKLLAANIAQLKQQLDETVARNKQGFVEKIDVDRLTVQYNSQVTRQENIIRLLEINYQLLKFQMGMPVDKALTLRDKLEDVKIEASAADANNDTTVYRNRIEYNLLETQKKLYGYDLKSKKGQFLPKLTANGNISSAYQDNSFSKLFSTNYPSSYIGLSLSVPIFTGFQHRNQLKQSEITVLKAQNDLDNMKNTVNLQVNQARIAYINGLQTLNDQKKNMALAEEVLRVSKIKYQQGVGSSIEVTQAQTAVQDADNSYIQGLYDALVSKVDLDKAYGRIQ